MNRSTVAGVWHNPVVFGARRMFYACSPAESSFKELQDVPEYVNQAVPFFVVFVMLETMILAIQGRWKSTFRPNDAFSSVAAGVISLLPLLFVRNIEMSVYIWINERFQIMMLPWDSAATWWLCMIGVDFGYYWLHRYCHEVNFMWAAHQVHHSSEDYNLTTALRQSVLQRYSSWVFRLPLALFIPPSVFLVHIQFNLIYQFWIHTECVKRLGPLEWILNTPSHHRVHHGRNRYCIDCNYAGTLIIWDRMFGTFHPEDDNDEVVYGLVHPLESWDPIYTQISHSIYIVKTAWNMPGITNKVSVFLKGPGWEPNKPRLGLITDIPDIHAPQPKYNKRVPLWMTIYAVVHFGLVLLGHQILVLVRNDYQVFVVFLGMVYVVWTLTNIGHLLEHKWYTPFSELLRCAVYLAIESRFCAAVECSHWMNIPRGIFIASVGMCLLLYMNSNGKKKKTV